MITSPDRNHQAECSLVLPSATNAPLLIEETSKLLLKKEETMPLTIEEIIVPQPEAMGQCKRHYSLPIDSRYVCTIYSGALRI